jgi:Kinesin motor domain
LDAVTTLKCATLIDDTTMRIMPPDGAQGSRKTVAAVDDKIFSFDKVFAEESTQENLYQSVSAHVKATVRGYNTTIFAYGSTGSGKSFTMTGNSTAPGIIPRAISEIFSIIEATAAQESDVFFYVRLSYVELYNNNFRNLLEFASKELALKEKEKSAEKEDDKGRPVSPTQLHPGLAQRTDKIEVRESQSAGVFLAGPCLRIPVSNLLLHICFVTIAVMIMIAITLRVIVLLIPSYMISSDNHVARHPTERCHTNRSPQRKRRSSL